VGREYLLTLSCPDKPKIVYAVSRFLVQHSAHIPVSQQYGENPDGRFFMRVHFSVLLRGVRLTEGLQLAELERDFRTAQCPIGQGISLVGKEAAHE
jgi:formyltetrahydrofolate hydrolase